MLRILELIAATITIGLIIWFVINLMEVLPQ